MPFDHRLCKQAHDLIAEYGSAHKAAIYCGIHHSTLVRRAKAYKEENRDKSVLPILPDDDLPIEEIIDGMAKRYEKRAAYQQALKWFPIKIKDNKPIGLVFVGDPHLDDDGCNWPLLKDHCEIMKSPGIYAVNIGDTTNNWMGRLISQFANQETSQKTARKLAKWFMHDSGIRWLAWLLGNHDAWNDGAAILKEMNISRIPMTDWQAQFKLIFPNNWECRVWASHDFPGHSMWNTLHGSQKAAHMKDWAHIYPSGHKHNWALHQEESASKDFVYWLARTRGYKFIDSHAEKLGHQSQQFGASIMAVINPMAMGDVTKVQCFADLEQGADYLAYLRS